MAWAGHPGAADTGTPASAPDRPHGALRRWVGMAVVAAVLLATLSLYNHPDVLLQVALQMWACLP